jgi:hypothetical protein
MKKLLFSLLVLLVTLLSFAPYLSPVKAQEWYSQDPVEWYLKVYDQGMSPANEIFGERYTAAQVQWVIYSVIFTPFRMASKVVGDDFINCFLKTFSAGSADVTTCVGGSFQVVGKIIDKLGQYVLNLGYMPNNNRSMAAVILDSSDRDISGIGYTKSLINKFSPVSEVKAQGVGYSGLTWVQNYWKGFRDMSYTLLVVVIIVFAFMIMFRVKLSPQTVISVQSALPKVVIAMILITFSYAIAGFAIDLMYVVSGIFALLLKYAGFAKDINAVFGTISGTGVGYAIAGGFWVFFEMLGYAILFFVAALWSLLTTFASGINLFGMVLSVVFMLLSIWILILCLWYTIKIPFVMLKTLISIYLSIITAPLQILAGTISPSLGFGAWFKRLMSDILVFPVIGLLFWFAWATLWSAYAQAGLDVKRYFTSAFGTSDTAWIPEIIGSRGMGHQSGISGLILLGISFGMIVLVPKVPELLKSIFLGEKFTFGTAFGEAAGPIRGVAGVGQGVALGGGAIAVGTKLETVGGTSRFARFVRTGGGFIKGYGQKALGQQAGTEINRTKGPGERE